MNPADQELAVEILSGMLSELGFQAEVTAQVVEGDVILLNIASPDVLALAGEQGRILDDWQILVSRVFAARRPSGPAVRVDAEGMRAQVEAEFRRELRKLAEAVQLSGKPRSTRSLNSWFRRIAHREFGNDPVFQTATEEGGMRWKKVWIRLRPTTRP